MYKRIIILAAALLMTASAFSCGDAGTKAEKNDESTTDTAEITTEPATEKDNEETTEKNQDNKSDSFDVGFGMMKYVKKSKQASATSCAYIIRNCVRNDLTEKDSICTDKIVYTNTGVGEFSEAMHEDHFDSSDDMDYIMCMDEDGSPKWVMCCRAEKKRDPVGKCGYVEYFEDTEGVKWSEVLEKFGFEQGAYSDIHLEKKENIKPHVPSNISYKGLSRLDLLALTICWEYNLGTSGKPFYYYGKWGADEPFTADVPWDYPEHGDTEFVIQMCGAEIEKVYCWECGTDRSEIGDIGCYGVGIRIGNDSWDDILSRFGYTSGEYVEY
ncbi:MAG: hypothetical protein K6G33_00340 [Ruminococcus sp.]|uniref:hypothetical protein n=1 Tax=Ruminococcus sp. TaxID=41978 RepID=UPI0025F91E1F|nr:hypothetical protein [Ruminococcus sp.]MCR5599181.1 hypothetical protein [Ruminococcus sp.]